MGHASFGFVVPTPTALACPLFVSMQSTTVNEERSMLEMVRFQPTGTPATSIRWSLTGRTS